MVATPSTMLPLGATLPAFTLSGPDATTWSTEDAVGAPALVVAFLARTARMSSTWRLASPRSPPTS